MSAEFQRQVPTRLTVKMFDDYTGFNEMRGTIIFAREADKIIHIVYDFDKDWLRVFTLSRKI